MPEGLTSLDDGSNVRKERVHTTMLIELLVTLVFLAMAFAFVQKDEQKTSVIQAELDQTRAELDKANQTIRQLERENADLKDENERLRDALARWAKLSGKTLPANEQPVTIPMSEFRALIDKAANATDMLNEAQKENSVLRSRLTGPKVGGVDLPNCAVTAGYLLRIDLLGSGEFQATAVWKPGATDAAAQVPGVSELISAGTMSADTFAKWGSLAAGWGRKQPVPCGFRVLVVEHHSDLDLYKKQLTMVERFFYDKRV